jgi:EmrB/QacA subfamily drug resistance transporter
MTELIIFRVIQGLGAGIIFANVFTSIADIFPDPARRAKYQGIFFGAFALSSVVDPALGGWITDSLDWRWVFYLNLPLGIVSLFALPFVLPEGGLRRRAKIDYLGAATITAAVVALLLTLSWVGQGYEWDAGRVVVGLIAAAILLVAFVFLETRVSEPVVPLPLFKCLTIAASWALMFLLGFGMFAIILYARLFVQGVLGQTATGSGTVLTPLVLTVIAMGVIGGPLMGRTRRVKPVMIVGTMASAFGVYLMSTLGVDSGTGTVALFLAVTGFGLGLIQPTSTLVVQTVVEKGILGVATSATQFVRQIGATVGTAVVGSIVTKGYVENLADNAPPQTPDSVLRLLSDPQALVSEDARQVLSQAASAFPAGTRSSAGYCRRHGRRSQARFMRASPSR